MKIRTFFCAVNEDGNQFSIPTMMCFAAKKQTKTKKKTAQNKKQNQKRRQKTNFFSGDGVNKSFDGLLCRKETVCFEVSVISVVFYCLLQNILVYIKLTRKSYVISFGVTCLLK